MSLFTKINIILFILYQSIQNSTQYSVGTNKFSQPGQFPYQVMLIGKFYPSGRILCGGALISSEWILTASHCVDDTVEITVHLGATDYNNEYEPGRIILRSTKYIMHEKYNPEFAANDIALVKIKPIPYTIHIQPVILPANFRQNDLNGKRAIASGWGANNGNQGSNDMQYADFKVIDNRDCVRYYSKSIIRDGVLCAKGMNYETVCTGDSGGPLVLKHSRILVGIVSFGPANGCKFGVPSGFTRVSYYLDWIHSKTGVGFGI